MEIKIKYAQKFGFTDDEIVDIVNFAQPYGDVITESWSSRFSALDLVDILEFSLGSTITKIVSDAYLKGLLNEKWLKEKGELNRKQLIADFEQTKNFISAFYKVFIQNKQGDEKSITFIEQFENCTIYVSLNNHDITTKLIDELANALVKTCGYISLKQIELSEPFVLQLYPNFKTESWDYLFTPTISAFGSYVDRYFDFRDNQTHYITSSEQFIELFDIRDTGEYKMIISALRYQK